MEIAIQIEGSGDAAALNSLLEWLSDDEYIRDNAQPKRRSAAGNLSPDLATIELILTAGFKIIDLAIKLKEWLNTRKPATPIVITPANGRATSISPSDSMNQLLRGLVGAPDPQESACVLIGFSDYGKLRELPQVKKNIAALSDVLRDLNLWGIPEGRLKTIEYPHSPSELGEAISEAANKATDTLFVYFAGHGLHDQGSELLLALPNGTGKVGDSTVRWLKLAKIIKESKARQKVVLLDCCYAGLAATENEAQAAELTAAARTTDTYVLAAALQEAKAPDAEGCTAFTGELVKVLRRGIEPGRPTEEFLSLNAIHTEVRIGLRARQLPEPVWDDRGAIGRNPQFRNNLERQPEPPSPVGPVKPDPGGSATGKMRRILPSSRARVIASTGVVAVVAAFLAYWFIPGPTVSGLDLAKYCSTTASGNTQSLFVSGTSCVRPVNLDEACAFSYQRTDVKASLPSSDVNSAECVNSSSSAVYGGISNMGGYCTARTNVPGVAATPSNPRFLNTWICQASIPLDAACDVQNNRDDLVSVTEGENIYSCHRAHLF